VFEDSSPDRKIYKFKRYTLTTLTCNKLLTKNKINTTDVVQICLYSNCTSC